MPKTMGAIIRTVLLGAVLWSALVFTGIGSAAAAQPSGPAACTVPHGPGPGYNATIGNKQNGKTVCIVVGEKLLVFLSAPSSTAPRWSPLHVAPPGDLKIAPLTLMLPRGATATNFLAVHPGKVAITSQRKVCPPAPSSAVACTAVQLWKATVVVRAPHKIPMIAPVTEAVTPTQ